MAKLKTRYSIFSGVNHLALVCKDMARTVDFYTNVLGMPLIKTHRPAERHAASISFSTSATAMRSHFSGFRTRRKQQPGVASAGESADGRARSFRATVR